MLCNKLHLWNVKVCNISLKDKHYIYCRCYWLRLIACGYKRSFYQNEFFLNYFKNDGLCNGSVYGQMFCMLILETTQILLLSPLFVWYEKLVSREMLKTTQT